MVEMKALYLLLYKGVSQNTVGKKVSFHPETGPEFPQNGKNPKLFGTNLFLSENF